MKIILDNGTELELQPASHVTMAEIISDLGGYELQSRLTAMRADELRAHFGSYTPAEMQAYLDAQHRQMLYCFGWGVKDTPPPDAVELLESLGRNSALPQLQRARWLVYVAGLTEGDKARVVGGVMALTYADELRRRANGN